MPAPALYPIPFSTLVARLDRELADGGEAYLLPRREWWTPRDGVDVSLNHFGHRLGTPAGPASGPHSQLAQNLVLSFLSGGRFMELKTVQVIDDLEIPRPCIYVPHIGFNVEWSQELRVPQSALEYVKGWMLVHMLAGPHGPGLWPGVDTVFDVSLGYDLAGIQTDKVRAFLAIMEDAGPHIADLWAQVRAELPASMHHWCDTAVPPRVSDSITLSTFHGCPADEIEAIASQTLDWGWHTVVKLDPTLLGHDRVRQLLDDTGYGHIQLDRAAFDKDLQWAQLMEMAPRLAARARDKGLGFGFKLTNTLVCHSDETPFLPADQGGSPEMYLSGPPLHVLSYTLAAQLRDALDHWDASGHGQRLPLTFSAGIDATNFADVAMSGIGPVTSCSNLLKVRGYGRMSRYVKGLETALEARGAASLEAWLNSGEDRALLAERAAALTADTKLHHAQNHTPPKKVGTQLVVLDCLTCDKCLPVCPNAANFRLGVERGAFQGQRLELGSPATSGPGRSIEISKRHQIGTHVDACNECGQCDPWCPEDGGPYIEKPNLFVAPESWGDHAHRTGFPLDPDRRSITWRRAPGDELTFTELPDGRAELRWADGVAELGPDLRIETARGHGAVDTADAWLMRRYLAAFSADDAATWLPPLAPSDPVETAP